jgi:hypothetical protein
MSEWRTIESVPLNRRNESPQRVLLFFPTQIVADNHSPQRKRRWPGYMEYAGAIIDGYAYTDVDGDPWKMDRPRIWWRFNYGWDQKDKYLESVIGPIEPTHWMPLPSPPEGDKP